MRLENKGYTQIGYTLLGVAVILVIGGVLLGDSHLDLADLSARVEIDGETLGVDRFDAVDLEASSAIMATATVSFTDGNGNSYSAVNGSVSMAFDGTDVTSLSRE